MQGPSWCLVCGMTKLLYFKKTATRDRPTQEVIWVEWWVMMEPPSTLLSIRDQPPERCYLAQIEDIQPGCYGHSPPLTYDSSHAPGLSTHSTTQQKRKFIRIRAPGSSPHHPGSLLAIFGSLNSHGPTSRLNDPSETAHSLADLFLLDQSHPCGSSDQSP